MKGPWQQASDNVTHATGRRRVGGIVRRKLDRGRADGPAPRAKGRRHRDEATFEPVIFAYLGAAMLTTFYFVLPASMAPFFGFVIAVAGTVPLVLSNYTWRAKIGFALPLWLASAILFLATGEVGAFAFMH